MNSATKFGRPNITIVRFLSINSSSIQLYFKFQPALSKRSLSPVM